MLSTSLSPHGKALLAAFGAGALCALLLPRVFLCILGSTLLLAAGCALSKHKEC